MAPFLYLKKQLWNAKRFGFTPDKVGARLMSPAVNKVVCICLPKSGTHLLERALCLHPALYRRLTRTLHPKNVESYGGIRSVLQDLRPGQLVFCHFSYQDKIADAIRDYNVKSLFLIRDPRDIVVSKVFYLMRSRNHDLHQFYLSQKDFRERLLTTIQGAPEHNVTSLGVELNRYAGWLDSGALVVRFEDLVGAKGGSIPEKQRAELSRIFRFIDCPLSEYETTQISEKLFSNTSPTFRKGSIGDWRKHFDSEIKTAFKAVAHEQLVQYGYEDDTGW